MWATDLPAARWIVNFDYDWMDGLVLATILAKFCPWVSAKFGEMHLNPFMPELCLHNALIITDVIRELQENTQTNTVGAKPDNQKSRTQAFFFDRFLRVFQRSILMSPPPK